jgi:hypothetical protein
MRRRTRLALAGTGLLCAAAGVWGVPAVARRAAASRDVSMGPVGVCVDGALPALCAQDVVARGVRVEDAVVRVDGRVRLRGVRVPWGSLPGLAADAAGGALRGGDPPAPGGVAWIRAVEVRDLRVDDAPVPLPAVSGSAFPSVELAGEGVVIRRDAIALDRVTPWGRVTAEVRPQAGGLAVEGRCDACVLRHADLDPAPVHLPPLRFSGRLHREAEAFVIAGEIADDAIRVSVEGRGTDASGEAVLRLLPVPVATLYGRLAEVVPEASRARIAGTVSGTVRVRWPLPTQEGTPDAGTPDDAAHDEASARWSVEIVPELRDLRASGLVEDRWRAGVFTWPARDAEGEMIAAQGGEGTPDWVPLNRLGPWLPAAVVAAEDGGFWSHPGYSLSEMQAAAARNARDGALRRGGSTLTQQLAKNLFLDGRRTYARKLRELLWAVDLERRLGKLRVLELYLNVVEWGPGIRGAKAAAWTYFAKSPAGLRPEEAAWLASILPYPRWAYRTQYLRARPRTERVATILRSMRHVDVAARDAALGRPVRLVPP